MAWIDFAICLFFGIIGVHKFKEKKILWGILYLLTCGLFGIGWIYDCIKYFIIAANGGRKVNTQYNVSKKTVKKKNSKRLFLWIPVVSLIFIVSLCMLLSDAIYTDIPNTYSSSSSSSALPSLSSTTSSISSTSSKVNASSSISSSKTESSSSPTSSKANTSSSISSSKTESSSSSTSSEANTPSSSSSSKPTTGSQSNSSIASSSKSTEEVVGNGLQVVSYPERIRRNEVGTVVIQGKPNTVYSISVYYKSGASKAEGLETKTSDANGRVSWSWKVGPKTSEGTFKIVVSGGGESKTVKFTVEK